MDFYNLFRGLKYFIKSYERFFKFVMFSLITIVFIILALLMLELKSYCETLDTFEMYDNTYNLMVNDNLYNALTNLTEFNDPMYDYFCFVNYNTFYVQFIPSNLDVSVYFYDISQINTPYDRTISFRYTQDLSNTSGLKYYEISESNYQINLTSDGLVNVFSTYKSGYNIYIYSSVAIYSDNTLNNVLYSPTLPIEPPEFLNVEITKYGNTLQNGKFNYFYINGNDLSSFNFSVIDNTLSDNNTIVFNLNTDSKFCYDKTLNKYAIPKTALTFDYLTEHTYTFNLDWFEGATPKNLSYTITTDFSVPIIINGVQNDLFSIDFEIQNISGSILNENFDFSYFIEGFPDFDTLTVPSTQLIDDLFNSIRQAFTDEYIYNELPTIDLPLPGNNVVSLNANYMYSHVPQVIITIIHIVYWFVISRFVLKDVLRTIDRIRQGDYFMGSDQNIKTEVL